jgi:hypothetical protein
MVAIFVLLLGGGLALWWNLAGPGDGADRAARLQPGELALDPFIVPILQEGRVTHHLTMSLRLELADSRIQKRALALLPRLQDALLRELHGLYSLERVRNLGFDSMLVHERLALASERVLGAGEVTGIALSILENRKPGA